MSTLGSYLRNAREARGLDLRDAAQQTRISINYLKAIEDEDFSKLPGEIFVKGFLKNYARFLRLPEDEVVKRYGERAKSQPGAVAPVDKKTGLHEVRSEAQTVKTGGEQPAGMSLEPFLWGGGILIGLVLFILVALPVSEPVHEQSGKITTQLTATDGLHAAATGTEKKGKLYLGIIAQEDTWVLVRTDSSPQKKAVLKKGDNMTWSADERFLLSYASIGSLKVLLNGNELTVNGPKNAVVRDLIVTAAGIAFQKVESEQPPRPRKPRLVTQPVSTAQTSAEAVPPAATAIPTPHVPVELPAPPRE